MPANQTASFEPFEISDSVARRFDQFQAIVDVFHHTTGRSVLKGWQNLAQPAPPCSGQWPRKMPGFPLPHPHSASWEYPKPDCPRQKFPVSTVRQTPTADTRDRSWLGARENRPRAHPGLTSPLFSKNRAKVALSTQATAT